MRVLCTLLCLFALAASTASANDFSLADHYAGGNYVFNDNLYLDDFTVVQTLGIGGDGWSSCGICNDPLGCNGNRSLRPGCHHHCDACYGTFGFFLDAAGDYCENNPQHEPCDPFDRNPGSLF